MEHAVNFRVTSTEHLSAIYRKPLARHFLQRPRDFFFFLILLVSLRDFLLFSLTQVLAVVCHPRSYLLLLPHPHALLLSPS